MTADDLAATVGYQVLHPGFPRRLVARLAPSRRPTSDSSAPPDRLANSRIAAPTSSAHRAAVDSSNAPQEWPTPE